MVTTTEIEILIKNIDKNKKKLCNKYNQNEKKRLQKEIDNYNKGIEYVDRIRLEKLLSIFHLNVDCKNCPVKCTCGNFSCEDQLYRYLKKEIY